MPAPSQEDLIPPFDPTGYPSISGAQLLQFLTGTYPETDKGFVLVTLDAVGVPTVPNATTTTKWQNYLWLRISATSVTVYVWNPNGATDATFLNWVTISSASIGAGTIINSMIADNTIQYQKIVSLQWSQLTGVPAGFAPTGAASGDLTGNYPSPSVANLAITAAKIALGTILGGDGVTTGQIAAKTITNTNLKGDGVAYDMLRVQNTAPYDQVEFFAPPSVLIGSSTLESGGALAAGANKSLRVIPAGTGYQFGPHDILQMAFTQTNTLTAVNKQIAETGVTPTQGGLGAVGGLTSIAFTPISATSTIYVEVTVPYSQADSTKGVILALFEDLAPTLMNATVAQGGSTIGAQTTTICGKFASISLTTLHFSLYMGTTTGGGIVNVNSTNSPTALLNGTSLATMKITEML